MVARIFTRYEPPIHGLAKLDHPGCKAFARLRKGLNGPSRHIVLPGHAVYWDLVGEIT